MLLCVIAIGVASCATGPEPEPKPPVQNLWAQTDDLGIVADKVLQLTRQLGAQKVLVVLDIDNTLLAMEQDLGSDQWYYWQKDLADRDPCSPMLVGDRFRVQGALFFASAMRPSQPDAAAQVRRIQDAGVTVIAITSRGPDYRLATFRELRRNGISFWPGALPPQRGYPVEFIPEGGSRPARYEDGVFLTAGQHKGQMLKALLEKTGTPAPTVVVIADDKDSNLRMMMETFAGSDTAVHAWRYSREDANVAALDTAAAAGMWDTARPALQIIQDLFGPDNFELAQPGDRPDCRPSR
jgi:hypothetical protein